MSQPLIGRDDSLARFARLLSQTDRSQTGRLWVSGPAGCGKSAFLQTCAALAVQAGWEVLQGQCTEETQTDPYGPFLSMLGLCFDKAGKLINDRSVHSIVDQISLDDISDAIQDIPGGTMLVFGIKVGLSIFELRRQPKSSDEMLNRNFEFILQVLQQIEHKRKKPVLLIIDDLHLSSATTIALIEYLFTRSEDARMAIMAAWQEGIDERGREYTYPLPARLASPDTLLDLPPLSETHMRQILAQAQPHPLGESWIAALLELSRGLPKVLIESLRLIDVESIERVSVDMSAAGAAHLAAQALANRQLEQLSQEQQMLLECASLLVQPTPLDLLASEPMCHYLGIHRRTQLGHIVELADRGTILTWDSGENIRFASAFLRQFLRERARPPVARRDHLCCAQAWQSLGDSSRPAQVALHNLAGGNFAQALNFALQSAQDLARSAAFPEAIQSYQLALQALHSMAEPDTGIQYDILRAMSMAAEQINDWEQAIRCLQDALPLSQNRPERRAEVLAGLGWLHFQRGQVQTALDELEQSAQLYQALNDPRGRLQVDYYLGMVYGSQKEWQRAIACFEQYLQTAEQIGLKDGQALACIELGNLYRLQYRWNEAQDLLQRGIDQAQTENDYAALAQGYHYLGLCYSWQGKPKAVSMLQQALDIVHTRTRQPAQESRIQNTLAETLVRQNRWSEAEEAFRASARIKERLGDRAGLAITYGGLGRLYSRQWRFDLAVEYLQKDIDLLSLEFEANLAWIQQWTSLIGEIRRLQGRLDLAEKHLTQAMSLAERIADPGVRCQSLGYGHMFQANLALDRSDLEQAAQECDAAMNLLAGSWAERDVLRTAARLARRRGNLVQAQQILDRALAAVEKGEDIDRAQTFLEQARLCRQDGDDAAAQEWTGRVIELAQRLQNKELEQRARTVGHLL